MGGKDGGGKNRRRGENRENRKNNNLEEFEGGRRRSGEGGWCLEEMDGGASGPMRATRRLGLGCQSGARLPGKNE
jgi:hypothetical protein